MSYGKVRLQNIEMKLEDVPKLQAFFKNGLNIMCEDMDYLDFYCIFSLVGAFDLPPEKVHIIKVEEAFKSCRPLNNELPCETEFGGINYTVCV